MDANFSSIVKRKGLKIKLNFFKKSMLEALIHDDS